MAQSAATTAIQIEWVPETQSVANTALQTEWMPSAAYAATTAIEIEFRASLGVASIAQQTEWTPQDRFRTVAARADVMGSIPRLRMFAVRLDVIGFPGNITEGIQLDPPVNTPNKSDVGNQVSQPSDFQKDF